VLTARFATLPPYEAYVDVEGVEHAGTNNGEVFHEPPPPPACYQKGKYNPSIFFQGMKFMLFGDPSAPMPATR